MLYKSPKNEIEFIQGSYVTPDEIEKILSTEPKGYDDSNKFVIAESVTSQPPTQTTEDCDNKTPDSYGRKELSEIIMWALEREKVSDLQVQRTFHMGNRAASVLDELCRLHIVGEKYVNQPRSVLPCSVDEVPDDAMGILLANGVSADDIETTIRNRS
jgi:hypothetical protein